MTPYTEPTRRFFRQQEPSGELQEPRPERQVVVQRRLFTLTPAQEERFLAQLMWTINNFLPDQSAADDEEPNNPADE